MKLINISTKKHPNTFVKVDDEDYEYVNQWKWHLSGRYVTRTIVTKIKNGYDFKNVAMHRVIMNVSDNKILDHINRDRLDNRKCNLRICTHKENHRNKKYENTFSEYKGVYKSYSRKKPFRARIKLNGININLGNYKTAKEAAVVYNEIAKKEYGEFAYLNQGV